MHKDVNRKNEKSKEMANKARSGRPRTLIEREEKVKKDPITSALSSMTWEMFDKDVHLQLCRNNIFHDGEIKKKLAVSREEVEFCKKHF